MTTESVDAVQHYITKAATDILKAASRKQTRLKDSCKATIEGLKGCTLSAMMGQPDEEGPSRIVLQIIDTMRQACETKSARMAAPALDSLHKLLAFGFVRGTLPAPDAGVRAADRVVETIVACYDVPDANVQLQILKACLTAATTPACDLHDAALMAAVRTCYNIFLVSRTPVNISTAKGILRQIVHHVFNRFEVETALRRATMRQQSPPATPRSPAVAAAAASSASASGESPRTSMSVEPPSPSASAEAAPLEDTPRASVVVEPPSPTVSAAPAETADASAAEQQQPPSSSSHEDIARDIVLDIIGSVGIPVAEAPPASPSQNLEAQPTQMPQSPEPATPTRLGHLRLQSAFSMPEIAEATAAAASASETTTTTTTAAATTTTAPAPLDSAELAFADCFLLFRALCKLSMKELPRDLHDEEAGQQLQSKVLALELLYSIMESAGPALRHDERFVEVAIKKHLCSSIVQNGVSTIPRVFKYSLSIFLSLMKHYKSPLKAEIGVFFSSIFLRVLESQNSTLQQKWMVLQLLHHVCKDPQSLVDLYLNYDCDLESTDVFLRMINDLSKVAQGAVLPLDGWTSPSQDMALRTLGLECLVMVMKSLVDWIKEGGAQQVAQAQPQLQQPREGTDAESEDDAATGGASPAPSVTPTPAPGTPTPGLGDERDIELDQFRKQKQRKQIMDEARMRWALAPRRAIEFLKKVNLIDDTPESLARFLREVDGLDKKALGEFLGGAKPFNKAVLKAYVELFDFSGMELDEALRFFLGQFWLPGEGQVVDRIMENFGSRFFRNNSSNGRFADADAVYKLSFAIILLATDIHNPKVKVKLKFHEWVKMIRDLKLEIDEDYLLAVRDRIAARKLEVVDSAGGSGSSQSVISDLLNPKQRQALFTEETSKWVDFSMKQMHQKRAHTKEFFHAKRIEYVVPIFESMWASAVVAFSILLESSDDPRVIDLCLAGFKYGIHIASIFFMQTERATFVTSLEKFTLLSNLREMRQKNVAAIRSLISIAYSDGNNLQESWREVLQCISLLERLHLVGSGLRPDVLEPVGAASAAAASAAAATAPSSDSSRRTSMSFFGVPQRSKQKPTTPDAAKGSAVVPQSPFTAHVSTIEASNSRVVSTDIDEAFIDRLFADSTMLNDAAIVDFVKALCAVSLSEISSPTPRIFSLQKIVEVASYNMNNRMRLVWSEIWTTLQQHFIACGCHEISTVSIYAIDSLRQLSVKYLDKDELANFNFQKEFLKPFEVVIRTTQSDAVKEFILQSLRQLVVTRTANIASGWKTIFVVLTTSAEEEGKTLPLAFELLADIMKNYYAVVSSKFFVELVNCLVAFGKNTVHSEISMRSIALLHTCAVNLVNGRPHVESLPQPATPASVASTSSTTTAAAAAAPAPADPQTQAVFTDSLPCLSAWFPILTGLSSIVSHPHIDVRSGSLSTLFSILSNNGQLFSPRLWELVFRGSLFPLFGSVGYSHGATSCADPDAEWLNTTCLNALQSLVSLFTQFFPVISFILPEMLELLGAFICQDNDLLAGIGSSGFYQLVMDNGPSFSRQMWLSVCTLVESVFSRDQETMRLILRAVKPPEPAPALPAPTEDASESAEPAPEKPAQEEATVAAAPEEKASTTSETSTLTDAPAVATVEEPAEPLPAASVSPASDSSTEPKQRKCALCGTQMNEKAMLRCPMCDTAWYCSRQCQKDDWPQHQSSCLNQYKPGSIVRVSLPLLRRTESFGGAQYRFVTLAQLHTGASAPLSHVSLESVGLSPSLVLARCEVLRVMSKAIEEVVFKQYKFLCTEDLLRIVDALACSVSLTSGILASAAARSLLQEGRLLEVFLRKERESLAFYLRVTFHMYAETETDAANRESFAEQRLVTLCRDILDQHNADRTNDTRLSNVLLVLSRLLAVRDEQYARHIAVLYVPFTGLIADDRVSVRDLARQHFARIGSLVHIVPTAPSAESH